MVEFFNIPQLYNIVERPRLFALLDRHTINKQVILIIGQPAQGKSTLTASYLKNKNQCVCWLHLDETDSDHIKLFYKIINSIVHTLKYDKKIKAFKVPQITLGAGEDILRYSEILDSLLSLIDIRLNLVFDDLESIREKDSGFFLIRKMIKNIPRNICCFMLSRSMPSLYINTLKMEENFFILTNKDLAFTFDETLLFFNRNDNSRQMKKKQLETIHKNTEGWAGGLTLVAENLRCSSNLSHLPQNFSINGHEADLVSSLDPLKISMVFTKHGPNALSQKPSPVRGVFHINAFSYFSEEIFAGQPRHIRDFLIKTSIFDTMDPEVLSNLWNINDVMSILGYLEKRNLFIQKIESNKKWPFFRYNNLFRDFLKKNLLNNLNKKEYTSLNNKAGRILKQKKAFEEAVECFLQAENFKEIAGIVKAKATDFLIKGRIGVIKRWIQLIPEKTILNDPWLLFYRTMTFRIKGGRKNISDFKKALELFIKYKNIRGEILCIAYLIEAGVFLREPSHIILNWIEKGKGLLKKMQKSTKYTWAKAILWQQIGLGYIAGIGEIPKGISACKNAGILAAGINNIDLGLNSSIIMIFGYVQAGDFLSARANLKKIEETIEEGQNPEYRALKNLISIDFALKKGDFNETGILLKDSESDIEKFGLIFLYPVFIELKALHCIYTKNHDAAMQTADHLSDFSILEGNNFYRGISHRIKAINYIYENLYKDAQFEAEKAVSYINSSKSHDIHFFLTSQISGFTMMYNKNYFKACEILEKACEYFESVFYDLFFTETCFALGIIFLKINNQQKSAQYLKQGIQKAIAKNYTHFPCLPLDEIIKAVILSFILAEDDKTGEKIKTYFRVFIPLTSHKKIAEIIFGILADIDDEDKLNKEDRSRGIERLKILYTISLPKIEIQTLGKFRIYKDKKELNNIEWEGTKPKLLLKSIILNGARDIPKEILIDNLWPDSSSKAGAKNFKINLHRLRKALEPDPHEIFGYSYIIHKQGLVSLNPELVFIDIDDFFKFCSAGEKKEKNNDIRGSIENYTKAADLYKGDYFTEEPYMDWLSRRRDLIRSRYISILQKKALLHEDINEIDQAVGAWHSILSIDPFYEGAYQNLMIIYADSGDVKKSINIFKQCRKIFRKELDLELDDATWALYNKINRIEKKQYI